MGGKQAGKELYNIHRRQTRLAASSEKNLDKARLVKGLAHYEVVNFAEEPRITGL